MARRKRGTPEQQARRALISELLSAANVQSIPKDIFMKVQEEIARRSVENSKKRRFSSNHAFSQIVFCSECEEIYKRLHWNNRGRKYIVWRCSSHLHEKKTCNSRTVREDVLQDAFLEAVNQIVGNSREYLKTLQQNLELAIKQVNPASIEYLDARMEDLQRELIDRTERHENYDDLAEEILRLRQLREQTVMDDVSKAEYPPFRVNMCTTEGVRVSGGHLCEAEAPTEATAETQAHRKLRKTEENIMWHEGTIGVPNGDGKYTVVHYWVKAYDAGSQYGIDGGRISKATLKISGEVVYNYDRGLDVPPQNEAAEMALAILMHEYN